MNYLKKKNKILIFGFLISIAFNFISVSKVYANGNNNGEDTSVGVQKVGNYLNSAAKKAGFKTEAGVTETTAAQQIGDVIKIILGFIGAIATLFIIYGGFLWITAGGSDEKVGKAKKFIINAAIGLIVTSLAYIIVSLLVNLTSGFFE
jgi:hypothetical protein